MKSRLFRSTVTQRNSGASGPNPSLRLRSPVLIWNMARLQRLVLTYIKAHSTIWSSLKFRFSADASPFRNIGHDLTVWDTYEEIQLSINHLKSNVYFGRCLRLNLATKIHFISYSFDSILHQESICEQSLNINWYEWQ